MTFKPSHLPDLTTSLHNHSTWSDGADPMEEMVRSAKASGFRVFGLSDHWVPDPTLDFDSSEWSMPLDRLPEYMEELHHLQKKYNDSAFTLLAGLEVDYFDENIDDVRNTLKQYKLDYIIGSCHYAGTFPVDHDPMDWVSLSQQEIDDIWDKYWTKLLAAARTGFYTFLAHLDLPKKYGHYPTEDQTPRALEVLDAARESGTAIEINTAGWHKPCKEAYPSPIILREAVQRNIPIVISADAHSIHRVDRDFEKASEYLALCTAPQVL